MPADCLPTTYRHLNVATKQLTNEESLAEKTNVFGVGLIRWCMVMNSNHPPKPAWLGNPALDTTLDIPAADVGHWSVALRRIIEACLLYDPAQRPSFDQILDRIRLATNESGANAATYMRSGTATTAQRALFMPQFLQDRYAIGLTADEVGVEI